MNSVARWLKKSHYLAFLLVLSGCEVPGSPGSGMSSAEGPGVQLAQSGSIVTIPIPTNPNPGSAQTGDGNGAPVLVVDGNTAISDGTIADGATGTISVSLPGNPGGTIAVTVTSSDAARVTVSPTVLYFDENNFNMGQKVTLTGVVGQDPGKVTISVSEQNNISSSLDFQFVRSPQVSQITGITSGASSRFVIDSEDNIYIADAAGDNGILKTSPSGMVTRFFPGLNASVVSKDSSDHIYVFTGVGGSASVPPTSSAAIQIISPAGSVSIMCNSASCQNAVVHGFFSGGVVDSQGNLYFSFSTQFSENGPINPFIAKVSPSGDFSVIAGSYGKGCADGMGSGARFGKVSGIAVDKSDHLFVLDQDGSGASCNGIRQITPAGIVTTLKVLSEAGANSLTMDDQGNFFYMVPLPNGATGSIIKKLSHLGKQSNYCGSAEKSSSEKDSDNEDDDDNSKCSTANLLQPSGSGLTVDKSGHLVFSQIVKGSSNHGLFKIEP